MKRVGARKESRKQQTSEQSTGAHIEQSRAALSRGSRTWVPPRVHDEYVGGHR
jgi:hypothetical protein